MSLSLPHFFMVLTGFVSEMIQISPIWRKVFFLYSNSNICENVYNSEIYLAKLMLQNGLFFILRRSIIFNMLCDHILVYQNIQ